MRVVGRSCGIVNDTAPKKNHCWLEAVTMLTRSTREIVERALDRPLTADEEAEYPALTALPPAVLDAAKKIRRSGSLVVVIVYLRELVPSVTLTQVVDFVDDLSL
jgi:hypothetical protein